jgi:hypothetical protein
MVARLTELITDPELRGKLGHEGLEGVRQHHSAETMACRACDVYRTMLNHHAGVKTRLQ